MARKELPWHLWRLSCILCSFSLWAAGRLPEAHGQQQENDLHLRNRLLQEAPAQWQDYSRRAKELQGSVSSQVEGSFPDNKKGNMRYRFVMKKSENCKLAESTREKFFAGEADLQIYKIFGVNPAYAFTLQRNSSTSPWTIAELIDLRKESLPPESKFRTYFDG